MKMIVRTTALSLLLAGLLFGHSALAGPFDTVLQLPGGVTVVVAPPFLPR